LIHHPTINAARHDDELRVDYVLTTIHFTLGKYYFTILRDVELDPGMVHLQHI
jgi:hypothetical protein